MQKHATLGLYFESKSNLHQLDARLKVPAAFALILLIGALPYGAWPVLLFVMFLVIGLQIASEIPFSILYSRSLIVIPFMLAAIPILFIAGGEPVFQVHIIQKTWVITSNGISHFGFILLKSWLSVQVAILLAATTTMMSMLNALRVYHVPKILVLIFRLMWRYLSIMITKAQRMMRARAARSVEGISSQTHSLKHLAWRAKGTGAMAGSLFVQSLEQSERVYTAMLSRGFDGELRLLPESPLTIKQNLVLSGWVIFCVFLFLLSITFG
jgi:cobalt/nickel transport system permease protein